MAKRTVKCPNCGASVPPTGACRFCGATAFVDGVAGRLLPSELHCPRCKGGAELRGLEFEGVRADLCMGCHGVWFGPGHLEEALRMTTLRPPSAGEGDDGPAHGGMEPVRYVRCPVCDGGMARVPFARKPLVIIDRCPSHGDWCDGGELGQLKVVARTRGVAALGPPDAPKEKPKVGRKEIVDLPLDTPSRWGGVFTSGIHRGPDLFDFLWDLMFKR